MEKYTKVFSRPYEDGYIDLPAMETPETAAIMNNKVATFEAIEEELERLTDPDQPGSIHEAIEEAIGEAIGSIETTHTTTEKTITNASDGNIVALSLAGNTTQNTEGKNRWSAGNLTVATKTNIAISIKAGNYYFSSTHSNGSLNVRAFFADGTNDLIIINKSTDTPVTIPKDVVSINYSINDFSDAWTNVQLELGNKKTEYEPYISAPLPNPQYPQPINGFNGIMGTQGKNLLNVNAPSKIDFPDRVSIIDNSIKLENSNYNAARYTYNLKAGDYIVSTNVQLTSGVIYCGIAHNFSNIKEATKRESGLFTIPFSATEDGNYEIALCGASATSTALLKEVQLEKGTQVTQYQKYGKSEIHTFPLYSIGDIKDEIKVYSDGSGELIKRIGVDNLWERTWGYQSDYQRFVTNIPTLKIGYPVRTQTVLCENYKCWNRGGSVSDVTDNSVYTVQTDRDVFIVDNSLSGNVDALKSSLNGAHLVYELATPTTTKLTPSEVAEILKLKTFKSKTYIDADNVDFELEYFADSEIGKAIADVNSKVESNAVEIETVKNEITPIKLELGVDFTVDSNLNVSFNKSYRIGNVEYIKMRIKANSAIPNDANIISFKTECLNSGQILDVPGYVGTVEWKEADTFKYAYIQTKTIQCHGMEANERWHLDFTRIII